MIRLRLMVAVLTAMVSMQTTTARPTLATDKIEGDALNRIAEEWRQAYNAKDGARLSSLYTDDAIYMSSHVPGLVAHGRGEIRANFQRGMDARGHVDSIKVLTTETSCDIAYSVCSYEATNDGVRVSGRNVLVLKRVRSKWQIASHVSVVPL